MNEETRIAVLREQVEADTNLLFKFSIFVLGMAFESIFSNEQLITTILRTIFISALFLCLAYLYYCKWKLKKYDSIKVKEEFEKTKKLYEETKKHLV